MSDYFKLPPSGMATASDNDTFLTQLLNDNMRKAGQQLPCCGRMPMSGALQIGYPARLSAVNPPTAGKTGPFLGVVVHSNYNKGEAVVQFLGLAEVVVSRSVNVGDFVGINDYGEAARVTPTRTGSDNFIGNVVEIVTRNERYTLARVLLRSWCGQSGRAWQGYTPSLLQVAAGLCAEHRPSGQAGLVGGVVSITGNTAEGFALINRTGTVMQDNSVRFSFKQKVSNCVISPADHTCTTIPNHDSNGITVARYNGSVVSTAKFNILCSVEAQNG